MRKFVVLLAIVGLAALSAVGMASAASNLPNATVLTQTNTGNVSFGSILTCTGSTLKGTLSNNPVGQGIKETVTSASFSGCGGWPTMTITKLPWTATLSAGGAGSWTGAVHGVDIDFDYGSGVVCEFGGSLTSTYNNSTERLSLSGTLPFIRQSGLVLCPTTAPLHVTGVYDVTPTLQLN